MLRSRAGWKVVTLLVLFLILRAIAGMWIEYTIAYGQNIAPRLIGSVLWVAVVVGLGFGLEPARFVCVIGLVIGGVIAIITLLDPGFREFEPGDPAVEKLKTYCLVVIPTNLVAILLLAFSKPVRSFFSKMPSPHFRPY